MNRKKPAELKKLQGTYQPCRDKSTISPSPADLGDPPDHLNDTERAVWQEIAERLPEGTAGRGDAVSFELLVTLFSRHRTGELNGSEYTLLARMLSKFGLTPADRGAVSPPITPKRARWTR